MDRGTVPAAFRLEILDKRAMALRDPPVLTLVAGHPLVAECERAGTARVGCVVAFDGPRDRLPQPIVLPAGKMRLQEIGDRQIDSHRAQGLVEAIPIGKRSLIGR